MLGKRRKDDNRERERERERERKTDSVFQNINQREDKFNHIPSLLPLSSLP